MVCARFVTFANCRTSRKRLSSTRLAEGGACCSDKYEVSVCRSGEVCAFCQREGMREGGREGQGTHAERQQLAAATSSLSIFRTSPALPGEEVLAARFEQEDAFLCQGSDSLDFSTASYYCDNHSAVCFWKRTINSTIIISARAFHLRTSAAHHSVHSSRRAVATAVCPSESQTRRIVYCPRTEGLLSFQRPFSNASLLQSGHRTTSNAASSPVPDHHHKMSFAPSRPHSATLPNITGGPANLGDRQNDTEGRCGPQFSVLPESAARRAALYRSFLTHIFLFPLTCPAGCK